MVGKFSFYRNGRADNVDRCTFRVVVYTPMRIFAIPGSPFEDDVDSTDSHTSRFKSVTARRHARYGDLFNSVVLHERIIQPSDEHSAHECVGKSPNCPNEDSGRRVIVSNVQVGK